MLTETIATESGHVIFDKIDDPSAVEGTDNALSGLIEVSFVLLDSTLVYQPNDSRHSGPKNKGLLRLPLISNISKGK